MVPPASAASLAQYIRERIVPPHIWANDEELKLVRDSGKVRFCFGNSPLDFSELHEYLHRLEAEIIQSFGVPASDPRRVRLIREMVHIVAEDEDLLNEIAAEIAKQRQVKERTGRFNIAKSIKAMASTV